MNYPGMQRDILELFVEAQQLGHAGEDPASYEAKLWLLVQRRASTSVARMRTWRQRNGARYAEHLAQNAAHKRANRPSRARVT